MLVAERFWAKVDPCRTDGCMVWIGHTDFGYGRFWLKDRITQAHHFLAGKPPEGLQWDHLCRNRACVNPGHLEAVTNRVNVLRGIGPTAIHARAIHCPQGHLYSEANTYIDKRGYRYCRICKQIARGRLP